MTDRFKFRIGPDDKISISKYAVDPDVPEVVMAPVVIHFGDITLSRSAPVVSGPLVETWVTAGIAVRRFTAYNDDRVFLEADEDAEKK